MSSTSTGRGVQFGAGVSHPRAYASADCDDDAIFTNTATVAASTAAVVGRSWTPSSSSSSTSFSIAESTASPATAAFADFSFGALAREKWLASSAQPMTAPALASASASSPTQVSASHASLPALSASSSSSGGSKAAATSTATKTSSTLSGGTRTSEAHVELGRQRDKELETTGLCYLQTRASSAPVRATTQFHFDAERAADEGDVTRFVEAVVHFFPSCLNEGTLAAAERGRMHDQEAVHQAAQEVLAAVRARETAPARNDSFAIQALRERLDATASSLGAFVSASLSAVITRTVERFPRIGALVAVVKAAALAGTDVYKRGVGRPVEIEETDAMFGMREFFPAVFDSVLPTSSLVLTSSAIDDPTVDLLLLRLAKLLFCRSSFLFSFILAQLFVPDAYMRGRSEKPATEARMRRALVKATTIVADIWYHRNQRCNYLQSVMALVLDAHQASSKTFRLLNLLGLSTSYSHRIEHVRRMSSHVVDTIKTLITKNLDANMVLGAVFDNINVSWVKHHGAQRESQNLDTHGILLLMLDLKELVPTDAAERDAFFRPRDVRPSWRHIGLLPSDHLELHKFGYALIVRSLSRYLQHFPEKDCDSLRLVHELLRQEKGLGAAMSDEELMNKYPLPVRRDKKAYPLSVIPMPVPVPQEVGSSAGTAVVMQKLAEDIWAPTEIRDHPVAGRMPMLVGGDMGSVANMQGVAVDMASDLVFDFQPDKFIPFIGPMHMSWYCRGSLMNIKSEQQKMGNLEILKAGGIAQYPGDKFNNASRRIDRINFESMHLALLDAFVRDMGWTSVAQAQAALALARVSFFDHFDQWLTDPSRSSAGREWVQFAIVQQRNMELFYLACKRGDFRLLISTMKSMAPVWLFGNNWQYLQRGFAMIMEYSCRWSPAVRQSVALFSLVPAASGDDFVAVDQVMEEHVEDTKSKMKFGGTTSKITRQRVNAAAVTSTLVSRFSTFVGDDPEQRSESRSTARLAVNTVRRLFQEYRKQGVFDLKESAFQTAHAVPEELSSTTMQQYSDKYLAKMVQLAQVQHDKRAAASASAAAAEAAAAAHDVPVADGAQDEAMADVRPPAGDKGDDAAAAVAAEVGRVGNADELDDEDAEGEQQEQDDDVEADDEVEQERREVADEFELLGSDDDD